MSSLPRGLETKSVFDWDDQPLGTVLGSEIDPKTRDPTSLIIDLSSDARERLGTDEDTVSLPFEYVFGIRRDEVRLSRGTEDLRSELASISQETEPEPTADGESSVELPA